MEVGELVAAMVPKSDDSDCPFDHEATKHDKKNVVPPPKTANNATILSNNRRRLERCSSDGDHAGQRRKLDGAIHRSPPDPRERSMAQVEALSLD